MLELLQNTGQENLTPSGQFDLIMEYYEPIFEKIYYDDYPRRKKELDQLKSVVAGYGDLQSFIDDTALDPPENISADELATNDDPKEQLILSTIHSAKGLEWDVVFVLGLAEGRFPHQNAVPGEQWEEERRLLYVAATRAKKLIYLSYPRELMTPDRKLRRAGMSPFLSEINPGFYEIRKPETPSYSASSYNSQESFSPKLPSRKKTSSARLQFKTGMKVHHPFFGPGRIKDVPGPRRVEVSFDRHGDKILHLDYAKLEPAE